MAEGVHVALVGRVEASTICEDAADLTLDQCWSRCVWTRLEDLVVEARGHDLADVVLEWSVVTRDVLGWGHVARLVFCSSVVGRAVWFLSRCLRLSGRQGSCVLGGV